MKYLKIFVILFILVDVLHKSVAQEEEAGEETSSTTATAADAVSSMTTASTAIQDTATTATTVTAATATATPIAQSGLAPIAEYLNRKIGQELVSNPVKTEGNLARIFNSERGKLENARITGTASDDAINQAEQALRGFETFLLRYKPIENMLSNALNDLTSLTENMKLPLELRYMALMLQSKLASSTNLSDTEETLKQYEEFRKGQANGNNEILPSVGAPSTLRPSLLPNLPPLNDEYRKYFEEIIQILRKNLQLGSPQMTNILQQVLNNPKQVKRILDNLKEVTEDIISDFLEDILDFF